MSSVTEHNITLAALGKQEENKNVEIQEENYGRGSTVLIGHFPDDEVRAVGFASYWRPQLAEQ